MEIIWHGNTCFTLKGKAVNVVINPDKDAGKLKGEVMLSALGKDTVPVEGTIKSFDCPGEYEVQGVAISAYGAWQKSKSKEEDSKAEPTIIFCLEMDGIKICNLGDLGHTLTSDMVNQIGDVDILMIGSRIENLETSKAEEIIEDIDPRIVIPMGVKNSPKVLEELGAAGNEVQDKFVIKSTSELPEDKQDYIVLRKV